MEGEVEGEEKEGKMMEMDMRERDEGDTE